MTDKKDLIERLDKFFVGWKACLSMENVSVDMVKAEADLTEIKEIVEQHPQQNPNAMAIKSKAKEAYDLGISYSAYKIAYDRGCTDTSEFLEKPIESNKA